MSRTVEIHLECSGKPGSIQEEGADEIIVRCHWPDADTTQSIHFAGKLTKEPPESGKVVTPQDVAPVLTDEKLAVFNAAVQRKFNGHSTRFDLHDPADGLLGNLSVEEFKYACILMERAGWVPISDSYYVGNFEIPKETP